MVFFIFSPADKGTISFTLERKTVEIVSVLEIKGAIMAKSLVGGAFHT